MLAAIGDAALNVVQRWCGAHIGEGLIFDLRTALFRKVQRMPIAFFTRTPTGAVTARLSTDVVGAQTAVTNTLGSVVSNVVGLTTALVAMLVLEWRLTLLALIVLPLFVVPARRVGRRLQQISREQMQHNAAMNTQMTERFNVAGALLVKLFGDDEREVSAFRTHAAGVRDAGVRQALYGRVFFVALGLVGADRRRRDLRRRRPPGGVRQHLDRHARRAGRAGDAHLRAAHVAHQHPRRPDDVDGELRAGLRGPRRARADHGAARERSTCRPPGRGSPPAG